MLVYYLSRVVNIVDKVQLLNYIRQHKGSEWEKLEKILLTVVGVILGASVTLFINKGGSFNHRHVLGFAWLLLSISLVSLLLSYAFSDILASYLLRKIDAMPQISQDEYKQMVENWWYKMTNIANYAALVCAVSGIITLVLFGYFNVS